MTQATPHTADEPPARPTGSTARLRRELERALPDRPFTLRFWDGSTVPGTAPGPTLSARSPRALAHVVRAPGLLGLGRAYVLGEIDVDDLDALVGLLGTWKPPRIPWHAWAELARARIASAGLGDSAEIRVVDYRDVEGGFDAVASIGMIEHVGEKNMPLFFEKVKASLGAGGRALVHGIALVNPKHKRQSSFADRYVFPDAHPVPLPGLLRAMERADLEATHVEGFRPDYAETLRHWIERLDATLDEAIRIAGDERVRVWRLYLRAARNGFLRSFTSVYQILCLPAGAGLALGGPRPGESRATAAALG